jgi:hypothetical protein
MSVSQATLDEFGLTREQFNHAHEQHKIYARLIAHERRNAIPTDVREVMSKATYHCDACDKTVRRAIQYQHERTQMHLKRLELKKQMNRDKMKQERLAAIAELLKIQSESD